MTIATLFVALIAISAEPGPGDPVLLDFHAAWCGPCQQMRPEVDKLVRKGYPIRSVDVDRSPELSERYKVSAVPTFIVVDARGRELAKASGAMPAARLAAFYNETKTRQPAGEVADGDGDDPRAVPGEGGPEPAPSEPSQPEASRPAPLVNPLPWQTVVRIKMHLSDSEWGFGSGTVISSTADEAIILTCAHIFRIKGQPQPRPRDFRVPITVDLFDGQLTGRQPAMVRCSEKDVVGEAIDYDFTNDVGLIRIRPGRRLASSRVVPPWWHPKKGMKMYTVGCSHGNDATAWDTTILDARVGMSNTGTRHGFATIKCAHQPKEGRSGGGLYTTDGYVAGVCDFADPNEHVGLYAVPEAIHRLLDRNNLMALYKPAADKPDTLLANNPSRPNPSPNTRVRGQSPTDPDAPPAPEAITIPPPRMLGIQEPRVASNARAWRSPTAADRVPTAVRPPHRPDLPVPDSIDPGARVGRTITTELAMDPGPDARAFDVAEAPAPRAETPAGPARSAAPGNWRPTRKPLPEFAGSAHPRR